MGCACTEAWTEVPATRTPASQMSVTQECVCNLTCPFFAAEKKPQRGKQGARQEIPKADVQCAPMACEVRNLYRTRLQLRTKCNGFLLLEWFQASGRHTTERHSRCTISSLPVPPHLRIKQVPRILHLLQI